MTREKAFSLLIAVVWLLFSLCNSAWAFSGSGSGTEVDPYVVTDVNQLQEMQDDLDACYVLGNDIDASATSTWNGGAGFEPVGNDIDYFTGKFDGQGYTIKGMYINRPTTNGVGVFGYLRDGAEVKKVGLVDADVTAHLNSGTLVGSSSGATVSKSWSSGEIRGSHNYQMRLGGLLGLSSGANSYVYQCFSSVNVTATGGAHQVGGLSGYNGHGSIMSDCYATGNVSGYWKVGGLVGDNPYPEGGYITRCYSTGKVSGNGGGLVGFNYNGGKTYDSYWDINTSGKSTSKGGTGKTTVQMMQQGTFVNWDFIDVWDIEENETYPCLRAFITPLEVAIDIKPGSCPNPLNLKSHGVLPVAILGSEDLDVNAIDLTSIRLAGVAPIRHSYEDVAAPVLDSDECECVTTEPDSYLDLTLKFKTQDVVAELIRTVDEMVDGQMLSLEITGMLSDETAIEGVDCVVLVGNVPRALAAQRWDGNEDGLINFLDLAELAEYWLEDCEVK